MIDQKPPYESPFCACRLSVAADCGAVDHVLPVIGEPEVQSGGFCEVRGHDDRVARRRGADLIVAGLSEATSEMAPMGIVAAASVWVGASKAACEDTSHRRATWRDLNFPRIAVALVEFAGHRPHPTAEAVATGCFASAQARRFSWRPAANSELVIGDTHS